MPYPSSAEAAVDQPAHAHQNAVLAAGRVAGRGGDRCCCSRSPAGLPGGPADGLDGGPSDATSERILADAEATARRQLGGQPPEQLPHLAAWREAYRAFGAKPQRTRPSVEALLRRLDPDGLPRIDRITDVYNAVSIAHLLPIGGEDRDAYVGPPRLVRADGTEHFDTTASGEPVVEHPEVGEVVWRDDDGVTCRRWNWRQCTRTRITTGTSSAVFILDALDPMSDDAVHAAADALTDALLALSPDAAVHRRLLPPSW